MNVKITDKQANRTTEDNTSDPFDENKFLMNRLMVAFDEIFRWRKFFAVLYSAAGVALGNHKSCPAGVALSNHKSCPAGVALRNHKSCRFS